MFVHDFKINLIFRHAIITCKCLFNCKFDEIKRKTKIKFNIVRIIYNKTLKKIEIDNFFVIIKHANNVVKFNFNVRISKNNQLNVNVREIILKHFYLKFHKTILNKKNIDIFFREKKLKNFISIFYRNNTTLTYSNNKQRNSRRNNTKIENRKITFQC